jgi:Na+-driven multidrug efflux pump
MLSKPRVLSSISGYVMSLSSLVILGKVGFKNFERPILPLTMHFFQYAGPDDLAGASLGTTFSNVCGCSMLVGFSEAIDTLCSQAYGQNNLKRIGRILQRGVVLLLVCATVSSLLCWFS